MAHLKVKNWSNAENDASSALDIDNLHVKSYQRRSAARLHLGKLRASLKDLHCAETIASRLSIRNSSSLAAEKKKVEDALLLAMKRAPKRKVSITIVKAEPMKPIAVINDSEKNNQLTELVSVPSKNTQICLPRPQEVKNWVQFEQIWKSLKKADKAKYLSSMKPQKIMTLYKNGMEDAGMLVDLLLYTAHSTTSANILLSISKIRSIDMTVMMMTQTQQNITKRIIEKILEKSYKCDTKKNTIRAKFGIKD